jgi:hypothetical protein
MRWLDALKQWNSSKSSWCIPKKGSKEYDEVKAIMNPPKPETKKIRPKKSTAKREASEMEQMGAEDINVNKILKKILDDYFEDRKLYLEMFLDDFSDFQKTLSEREQKSLTESVNDLYDSEYSKLKKYKISKNEMIDYLTTYFSSYSWLKNPKYSLYDIVNNTDKIKKVREENKRKAEEYDKHVEMYKVKKIKELLEEYSDEAKWKKLKDKAEMKSYLAMILNRLKSPNMTTATNEEIFKLKDSVADHLVAWFKRYGKK